MKYPVPASSFLFMKLCFVPRLSRTHGWLCVKDRLSVCLSISLHCIQSVVGPGYECQVVSYGMQLTAGLLLRLILTSAKTRRRVRAAGTADMISIWVEPKTHYLPLITDASHSFSVSWAISPHKIRFLPISLDFSVPFEVQAPCSYWTSDISYCMARS